jgi:hypothetical protein
MDELSAAPRARRSLNFFSLLAVLFLALSCVSALCVGTVFAFPGIVPAPFQAPTFPSIATRPPLPVAPSATHTSIAPTLPPEWTATFTLTPSITPTPSDTPTLTPSRTPRGPTDTPTLTPSITPTPSNTPTLTPTGPTPTPSRTRSAFNYTLQGNQPTYLANFANSAGCNWQGIAGQAFDLAGRPVVGLLVHLEGGGLNVDAITGSKPEYGTGGYEFFLNSPPRATTNTYRVQLRTTGGQPLSDTYVINTFDTCDKNLALVNFVQNH